MEVKRDIELEVKIAESIGREVDEAWEKSKNGRTPCVILKDLSEGDEEVFGKHVMKKAMLLRFFRDDEGVQILMSLDGNQFRDNIIFRLTDKKEMKNIIKLFEEFLEESEEQEDIFNHDIIKDNGFRPNDMKQLNDYFDNKSKHISEDNKYIIGIKLKCGKIKTWKKRQDIKHENVKCTCGCGDYFIKFGDLE